MSLSKPEFPSQLFAKHFEPKLFLSLELICELVALQHRQRTGEAERMGDFAPDYRELLKEAMDSVLPSCWKELLRQGQEVDGAVQGRRGQQRAVCGEESAVQSQLDAPLAVQRVDPSQLHGAAVQPGDAVLRLRTQQGLWGVQGGCAEAVSGQAPL